MNTKNYTEFHYSAFDSCEQKSNSESLLKDSYRMGFIFALVIHDGEDVYISRHRNHFPKGVSNVVRIDELVNVTLSKTT